MNRLWLCALGIPCCLVACDSKPGPGTSAEAPYANTSVGLCELLRDLTCAQEVTCGSVPDLASCAARFDVEQCAASTGETDGGSALELTLDSRLAASCVAQLSSCGQPLPAPCDAMIEPKVVEGGACSTAFECQGPDANCSYAPGACQGACSKPPGVGQACYTAETGYLGCAKGTYCDDQDVCAKAAQVGEACGETRCDDTLYCVEGKCGGYATASAKCPTTASGEHCEVLYSECSGGTCTLGVALWVEMGKSCAPYDDSPPGVSVWRQCQTGLGCGPAGTCVPPIAEGGACDPQSYGACAEGLDCDAISKTCKAWPKTGEACGDEGPFCSPDQAWCNEGKCAALPGNGEDCSQTQVCAERLLCNPSDWKCAAPLVVGASCAQGRDCASNRCLGGTCAEACE